MVADGLPILDRAGPYRNAYIATGYSMLGMTLVAPAGEAMAEMIVTDGAGGLRAVPARPLPALDLRRRRGR